MVKIKGWKLLSKGTGSARWRQEGLEYPIFVQVNKNFTGDRKPEVNIWKQQKNQKSMAKYLIHGKKFNSQVDAFEYARSYMKRN